MSICQKSSSRLHSVGIKRARAFGPWAPLVWIDIIGCCAWVQSCCCCSTGWRLSSESASYLRRCQPTSHTLRAHLGCHLVSINFYCLLQLVIIFNIVSVECITEISPNSACTRIRGHLVRSGGFCFSRPIRGKRTSRSVYKFKLVTIYSCMGAELWFPWVWLWILIHLPAELVEFYTFF